MHSQRELRQPHFYWEFKPHTAQLLNFNSEYKHYLDLEKKHQEARNNWIKELKVLNDQAAKGLPIHSSRWATQDKKLEELNLDKSKRALGKERLAYSIELLSKNVFGMFQDIEDDFQGGYLNQEQFNVYLQTYLKLFKSADELGLTCYQKAPADAIWKEIHKYLKPVEKTTTV